MPDVLSVCWNTIRDTLDIFPDKYGFSYTVPVIFQLVIVLDGAYLHLLSCFGYKRCSTCFIYHVHTSLRMVMLRSSSCCTTSRASTHLYARIALLILLAVCFVAYLIVPAIHSTVNSMIAALANTNLDGVVTFIRSYGTYAMIISFVLMVFSSVIAPLPAFMITFSNAIIFGWWQGAILSWTSAMVGAALCYGISRVLGRDLVEKYATRSALAHVESYFERYGSKTILICRLLPFVSFDAVSYFAGLTPIKLLPFLIATGIGQLPATIIYSYVGGMLTGSAQYVVTALLCIFALTILISIIKRIYEERHHQAGQ